MDQISIRKGKEKRYASKCFMNKWYDNLVSGYAIFGLYWLGGCGGALLLVLSICTGIVSLPLWLTCLPFALPVGILFVSLSGLPYFKMISWSKSGQAS